MILAITFGGWTASATLFLSLLAIGLAIVQFVKGGRRWSYLIGGCVLVCTLLSALGMLEGAVQAINAVQLEAPEEQLEAMFTGMDMALGNVTVLSSAGLVVCLFGAASGLKAWGGEW